jgi:hypothetical protein
LDSVKAGHLMADFNRGVEAQLLKIGRFGQPGAISKTMLPSRGTPDLSGRPAMARVAAG